MRTDSPSRQDKTAQRRRRIVEAALSCFVTHGFHRASLRDIAGCAGVSLGNVYNHFASKEALIAEIATLEAEELAPLLDGLRQRDDGAALLDFARDYLALCRQPVNVALSAEVIAEAARKPELAALFAANRQLLVQGLAEALRRAVLRGEVDASLPPEATAQLLLDAVEGMALRGALFAGTQDDAADLFRLLEKLLR